MAEIEIPFPLQDMPIKPEMTGRVKIDETVIQTIAALCGWNGEARRLLTCALSGALHVTTPPVCCITNKHSVGGNEHITFGDIPTTEVMVLAKSGNSNYVWVNVGTPAGTDVGWPLSATECVQFSINNMSELRIFITGADDRVVIMRTV